jgi:hypothetical protein
LALSGFERARLQPRHKGSNKDTTSPAAEKLNPALVRQGTTSVVPQVLQKKAGL